MTNIPAINIQTTWPQPDNTITRPTGIVYTIGQSINQGAYALVYEATDSFGNSVALKIFKPANRPFDEVKAQWDKETVLFNRLRHQSLLRYMIPLFVRITSTSPWKEHGETLNNSSRPLVH